MKGAIRAIAMDVDGVLTDGTFGWDHGGGEQKRFSFRDVMGISVGRKAGLVFALISGEDSPLAARFAEKVGIEEMHLGCKDKASALRAFADRYRLALDEIGFIGDDVNDLPALAIAGLSAAPADAHPSVLSAVQLVTRQPGGRGAVRELVDHVLAGIRS